MLRAYSFVVLIWAITVGLGPWFISPEFQISNSITSAIGVALLVSAIVMWRKAGSEAC